MLGDTDAKRWVYSYDSENEILVKEDFESLLNKNNQKCRATGSDLGYLIDEDHGSSFIDMNADCRSDLLIVSKDPKDGQRYHEVYMYTDDGFCLSGIKPVSSNLSMPSFMDLHHRGSSDLIMVESFQDGKAPRVHVNRNIYKTDMVTYQYCQKTDSLAFPYPGYEMTASGTNKLVYD